MSYPIYEKLTQLPNDIVALEDYQRLAPDFIPEPVYTYIRSGGADEHTLRRNSDAFNALSLYNRVLVDFDQANTHTQLLGECFRHPILLAPVAHQGLVHTDAELATAQAADALEAGLICSTLASKPMEQIAANTTAPKWFQLYFQASRQHTKTLVERAAASGYTALVVTVDVPINGLRNPIQRSGFQLPDNIQAINTASKSQSPVELNPEQSIIFQGLMSEAPTWRDIEWLRQNTQLPIILKGISHPKDAQRALSLGIDGFVVSNHGGRSLDTLPATIDMLPAIRQIVGDTIPVLLDGGVRRGTDIFKALALGADAVLIGRPQIYALAVAGALGVAHMLKLLRDELEVTMALCGCPTLKDINPDCLFKPKA
ncbi:MAG: alpha-hydroxy-acid oxidizing enzyme [Cellvibrionaceae bacterium]|nr:alpha-hydroxy-acid oxidizing enzyme [Cellvibrionaceae bacterium]|tara:strand:- start:13796 stop:14908 length:1113 start_codon:yes stop_codon:yes gene_type:complete